MPVKNGFAAQCDACGQTGPGRAKVACLGNTLNGGTECRTAVMCGRCRKVTYPKPVLHPDHRRPNSRTKFYGR